MCPCVRDKERALRVPVRVYKEQRKKNRLSHTRMKNKKVHACVGVCKGVAILIHTNDRIMPTFFEKLADFSEGTGGKIKFGSDEYPLIFFY